MSCSINFTYPWLLLLLIPAAFLTFFPYFRLAKKYRRTRNRICSLVLHSIVMVLAVLLLAGTTIVYSEPNKENELLLLVDVSETEEQSAEARDNFVKTVLTDASYDNFKVGVVTFGYDQVYAVPMTNDANTAYDKYIAATKPDTTATNIAAAFNYVIQGDTLFTSPQSAKIVLITDAKETDEDVSQVIRSVAAKGIKVDTAYISSSYDSPDVQISSVTLPETHITAGQEIEIVVTVMANTYNKADSISGTVTLIDNDVTDTETAQTLDFASGAREIVFKHTFAEATLADGGFHRLEFKIDTSANTDMEVNNSYYTYVLIEHYNKVLVLESRNGDSDLLEGLLSSDDYKEVNDLGETVSTIKVMNILNDNLNTDFPKTTDGLREYDQVILNNVSFSDMPDGFEDILYDYVYNYGGGLFTIGGNDDSDSTHAYSREDVANSVYYKQLLPVSLINYTPPVGVIVIVDRSGSMAQKDETGTSYLMLAKSGLENCLSALTDRDYIGIMTLDTNAATVLQLTQRTHEREIREAISNIEDKTGGGTKYAEVIENAGRELRSLEAVEKRHIIIVTDGAPADKIEDYEQLIAEFYQQDGTTFSVVVIGQTKPADYADLVNTPYDPSVKYSEGKSILDDKFPSGNGFGKCLRMAKLGNGSLYWISKSDAGSGEVSNSMKEDLNAPAIKEAEIKEFTPVAVADTSTLFNGVEMDGRKLKVNLGGFYGGKLKNGATVYLVGDYSVPIYAQWKVGKGSVGSFMSDLNGNWSTGFLSETGTDSAIGGGRQFILNVIANLMPTENIRATEIRADLTEDNYTNKMSVYATVPLGDGESIVGKITSLTNTDDTASLNDVLSAENRNANVYVTSALSLSNNYSRCNFVVKKGGTYEIVLQKLDANGNVLAEYTMYKSFSFSREYDTSQETEAIDYATILDTIAKNGNGERIADLEDTSSLFKTFVTSTTKTYDPRWLFAIIIIVAFLLDIAVRKFKFKWIHELIRDYKIKKAEKTEQDNSAQ